MQFTLFTSPIIGNSVSNLFRPALALPIAYQKRCSQQPIVPLAGAEGREWGRHMTSRVWAKLSQGDAAAIHLDTQNGNTVSLWSCIEIVEVKGVRNGDS